jgi:hypothetical protein
MNAPQREAQPFVLTRRSLGPRFFSDQFDKGENRGSSRTWTSSGSSDTSRFASGEASVQHPTSIRGAVAVTDPSCPARLPAGADAEEWAKSGS